ncbi:hypothetical protein [Moorena producens]|uniref:hypothetical protein n=1 Tax=Moorena producens TaxID=1155739 RepID=UPI001314C6EC|nr:hypothetical protein [Moorena producens]
MDMIKKEGSRQWIKKAINNPSHPTPYPTPPVVQICLNAALIRTLLISVARSW